MSDTPGSSPKSPFRELVNDYYTRKPDFKALENQYPAKAYLYGDDIVYTDPKEQEEHSKTLEAQNKRADMPVHPAEENTGGSIFDQVAKESKDSNASDHPLHDVDTGASSGGMKASIHDHKATPGPAMSDNLGKPASKDELKARAAELNKE
ncbi:hypothetical protein LTR66_011560 [Elasticomyces elasticus]|nr:hypothetical protein LTR28_004402 [Elasticomyces elasticus]KAK4970493.1 hypothetical protein LTR66_011560 [Elasticomyces elasticus]